MQTESSDSILEDVEQIPAIKGKRRQIQETRTQETGDGDKTATGISYSGKSSKHTAEEAGLNEEGKGEHISKKAQRAGESPGPNRSKPALVTLKKNYR